MLPWELRSFVRVVVSGEICARLVCLSNHLAAGYACTRSPTPMSFMLRFLLVALVGSMPFASADAADLLWDFAPGTPGAQDGPGDWNTTTPSWLVSATQNTNWSNSTLNNAVFGSGAFADTVTVTRADYRRQHYL